MDQTRIQAKKAAAYAAAEMIQNEMLVGIGTGSTTEHFITKLGWRCQQENLKISAVATSEKSRQMALQNKIPMVDINTLTYLDVTVDGADEITAAQHKMIKGGGGALLREKIVASMSREMIVIVDQTKVVDYLGAFPLPVEIIPFAWQATQFKVNQKGFTGQWRVSAEGKRFITDNGNFIYDISFAKPLAEPEKVEQALIAIPGVIETGFFFGLATKVIVGHTDGRIEIHN